MGDWISGRNILVKHQLEVPDLIDFVVNKGLQPYNHVGNPKSAPDVEKKQSELENLNYELARLERHILDHSQPGSTRQEIINIRRKLSGIDDNKEIKLLKEKIDKLREELPQGHPYSWENCCLPNSDIDAIKLINGLKNSYFKITEVKKLIINHKKKAAKDTSTKNKLRPNQRHKLLVREAAKKKWETNPEITIADMIQKNEIHSLTDGKVYAENTLRAWIKDLCPNRKPGRRPKKI